MASKFDLEKSILDRIKEKISVCTRNHTSFYDVSTSYNVLPELKVEVTPDMEEVDFYGGYAVPEHDYVPYSSESAKNIRRERDSGIRKSIDISHMLNTFKQGHLTFVGPAGSGKSTLMKVIARGALYGHYENLSEVAIVQFMEGRDINFDLQMTPLEMLFCNVDEMEEDEFDYMKLILGSSPSKILFVLDSLDTLRHPLDGVYESITLDTKAYPQVILHHLLAGELFPGCRIITSSREHAIRNYQGSLRANKVISLVGLSDESMEKIVTGYLGAKGSKEIATYLETKTSPALKVLCRTPLFLVFFLIGMQIESSFKPSTMSGIMILLLQCLIHSEHAHEKNIMEVIHKLKRLSFIGTNDGRVLFTTTELTDIDLDINQVTDLAILVPGGHMRKLLESHHNFLFFCHQSLQELLTSMYIIEMQLDSFKSFLDQNITKSHYAVIRQFLCGLLCDENVREATEQLVQAGDISDKQIHLKKIMKNMIRNSFYNAEKNAVRLECCISLSEAGDGMSDIIRSSVHKIAFRDAVFAPSDIHAIGSVARQCISLKCLDLSNSSLNSSLISTLGQSLKGSQVMVGLLTMNGHKNMEPMAYGHLAEVIRITNIKSLSLGNCNLTSEKLQAFNENLPGVNSKMNNLIISGSKKMDPTAYHHLAGIICNAKVESLKLISCNVSSDQLETFSGSLRREDVKMNKLEIQRNCGMESAAFRHLVAIVQSADIQELGICCNLTTENLKVFNENLCGKNIGVTLILMYKMASNIIALCQGLFVQIEYDLLMMSVAHFTDLVII